MIGDARSMTLPDGSIDLFVSNNTFEYIPADVLQAIGDEPFHRYDRSLCPLRQVNHSFQLPPFFQVELAYYQQLCRLS
jgi:hypothetical protein